MILKKRRSMRIKTLNQTKSCRSLWTSWRQLTRTSLRGPGQMWLMILNSLRSSWRNGSTILQRGALRPAVNPVMFLAPMTVVARTASPRRLIWWPRCHQPKLKEALFQELAHSDFVNHTPLLLGHQALQKEVKMVLSRKTSCRAWRASSNSTRARKRKTRDFSSSPTLLHLMELPRQRKVQVSPAKVRFWRFQRPSLRILNKRMMAMTMTLIKMIPAPWCHPSNESSPRTSRTRS